MVNHSPPFRLLTEEEDKAAIDRINEAKPDFVWIGLGAPNGVVERSRYDMSFKYFLELTPEEEVIHPSLLTKFRKQRLKDENILDLLINKSVELAINQGVLKSNTIIVDSTHVCPYRNGCYKENAKNKTYSITIKSDYHKNQEAFQKTQYFKERFKTRYMIEAKNSELKNIHGYSR